MMPSADQEGAAIKFFKAALAYFLITLLLGLIMITGKGYALFGSVGAKPAHVHAGLLGFITLIIMGSMYQIVPTLTGTKLYGGKLERKQFLLINIGILGLFITLLFTKNGLRSGFTLIFGAVILLASILFAFIIFKTMSESRSNIKPVTVPFFKAAIIYYLAAIIIGLAMTAYPRFFSDFLYAKTAHAHLGTLGFITMTIFGAEYQMFPMLSMQKLWSEKLAKFNFWTFATGVAGFYVGLMTGNAILLTIFVAFMLLSIYTFLINMLLTIKGASWSKLDISVKYLIFGQLFLFVTIAVGASLAVFNRLNFLNKLKAASMISPTTGALTLIWTHAHLALIGFVTLTIVGAVYHLAPMLIWMKRYGPKMGKEPVPKIQDLFSQTLARIILWAIVLGLIGILVGSLYSLPILLKTSAFVIAAAGALFTAAIYKVMFF